MRVGDLILFFFSSRRRHTRSKRDWSSDVCSSDLSNRNRWFRKPKLYPVELRGRTGATRLSHASIRGKCWVKPTTALLRILASKFYVCTSTTAQAPDNRHSCACDHGVSNGVPILATSRE